MRASVCRGAHLPDGGAVRFRGGPAGAVRGLLWRLLHPLFPPQHEHRHPVRHSLFFSLSCLPVSTNTTSTGTTPWRPSSPTTTSSATTSSACATPSTAWARSPPLASPSSLRTHSHQVCLSPLSLSLSLSLFALNCLPSLRTHFGFFLLLSPHLRPSAQREAVPAQHHRPRLRLHLGQRDVDGRLLQLVRQQVPRGKQEV